MSNVTLYLHGGLHKTGSTYIQHNLMQNYDILRANGILFPRTGFGSVNSVKPVRRNGVPGHQGLISAFISGNNSIINDFFKEVEESNCTKIILSNENLSAPKSDYSKRRKNLSFVKSALSPLKANIVPILSYRRPDKWLDSYYKELLGNGAIGPHESPDNFFYSNRHIMDIQNIFEDFEKSFKREPILFSFDQAKSNRFGILYELLKRCDSDNIFDILNIGNEPTYERPCNQQLACCFFVNEIFRTKNTRREILRKYFEITAPSSQTEPVFSKQVLAAASQRFSDSFTSKGLQSPIATSSLLEEIDNSDAGPHNFSIGGDYLTALIQAILDTNNSVEHSNIDDNMKMKKLSIIKRFVFGELVK